VAVTDERETWYDEAAGPLVRPYAVTRGRTKAGRRGLDMITLVVSVRSEADFAGLEPECVRILRLCRRPLSIIEIAAMLNLPLVVVKVLVGDLIDQRYVVYRSTEWPPNDPDTEILQKVLNGLRNL